MTDENVRSLVALELADRMLAEAASVDDVQKLIKLAEMARVYARQARLGTSAINHATVVKVRAERKMADIVDQGQKVGEIAVASDGPMFRSSSHPVLDRPATLADLGIDKPRLSEARILRDTFSDDDLLAKQKEANERDEELSRSRLLAEARATNDKNGAIQRARVDLVFPIYDALKSLAECPVTPEEWVKQVLPASRYRVDSTIEQAAAWLSELLEVWE